jgi:hypothetical protein
MNSLELSTPGNSIDRVACENYCANPRNDTILLIWEA